MDEKPRADDQCADIGEHPALVFNDREDGDFGGFCLLERGLEEGIALVAQRLIHADAHWP